MGDRAFLLLMIVLVLNVVSIILAGMTARLARADRATIRMTRPNYVAFAFDGPDRLPKVFVRTMLHATTAVGEVVEAFYVIIRQGGREFVYPFWGYQQDGRMVVGGAMFVGRPGLATDHHFVVSKTAARPRFSRGELAATFLIRVSGEVAPRQLFRASMTMTDDLAGELNSGRAGVAFERSPDADTFGGSRLFQPEDTQPRPMPVVQGTA